jgi:hypothetical protein
MTKNVYRMAGLAVVAGATIALTACTCPCPQTVKKGTLTQSVTTVMALSTNQSQGSFMSRAGGTNCCSSCGYINFYNSGAGWPLTGGVTVTVPLSRFSTMSPLIDPSAYCVWYRYGGQPNEAGCFSGSSFTPPVTGTYVFTVYIKTDCPANGTPYYLNVFFGR